LQNVRLRLDAWREAERRRDVLALDSPDRVEAEQDVRTAATLFHAEVAQVSARYVENEYRYRHPSSGQSERAIGRWSEDSR
jgi:hypothetical protein